MVEDEYLVALDLKRMLGDLGAEVVGPVAQLERAQEVARSEPLGGAILDVNLNGRTIWPVADELMARGVPVILATGIETGNVPAGYEDLPRLHKPFDDRELQRVVGQAFGRD